MKKNAPYQLVGYLSTYKFSLLCFLLLSFVTYLQVREFTITGIVNAASILLILNILAKTKNTAIAIFVMMLLISFDVFFVVAYSEYITLGVLASIVETNQSELFSMGKEIAPLVITVVAFVGFFIVKATQELKFLNLSRKRALLLLVFYWVLLLQFICIVELNVISARLLSLPSTRWKLFLSIPGSDFHWFTMD